jgi:hypothetical protein
VRRKCHSFFIMLSHITFLMGAMIGRRCEQGCRYKLMK